MGVAESRDGFFHFSGVGGDELLGDGTLHIDSRDGDTDLARPSEDAVDSPVKFSELHRNGGTKNLPCKRIVNICILEHYRWTLTTCDYQRLLCCRNDSFSTERLTKL